MSTELSQLIIRDAFADEEVKHEQKGSSLSSFLPIILITAVFFFLVIRPQQKKNKEHQEKLKSLSRGNEVITAGGIVGTVTDVDDNYISVEIAKDVQVKVIKSYVVDCVEKKPSEKVSKKKTAKKNNK